MKDCPLTPESDTLFGGRWRLRAAALVPFMLLASHAAHAQLQGSANLTNLQYEVTDLRPDDGLGAGYTLGSSVAANNLASSDANAFVQRGRQHGGPVVQEIDTEAEFGVPVSAEVNWYAGTGRSSYDESEGLRSFAYMSDGGRAFGSAALDLRKADGLGPLTPESWGGVMLAPYTSLTISGDALIELIDLGTYYGEGSYMLGRTYMAWHPESMLSVDFRSDRLDFELFNHSGAGTFTEQRRLQITITNDSNAPQFGALLMGAHTSVGVVPEPSTYALIAAGLGAIAMVRRRVNRAARHDNPPPST